LRAVVSPLGSDPRNGRDQEKQRGMQYLGSSILLFRMLDTDT
jgi:hypothetical protein